MPTYTRPPFWTGKDTAGDALPSPRRATSPSTCPISRTDAIALSLPSERISARSSPPCPPWPAARPAPRGTCVRPSLRWARLPVPEEKVADTFFPSRRERAYHPSPLQMRCPQPPHRVGVSFPPRAIRVIGGGAGRGRRQPRSQVRSAGGSRWGARECSSRARRRHDRTARGRTGSGRRAYPRRSLRP